MNFLDKMERKYGRYALKNLPMFIIATYVAGYVLELLTPEMLGYLTLEPYYILHGQIWRLVTWILIPPSSHRVFLRSSCCFSISHWTDSSGADVGQLSVTMSTFLSGMIFTVIWALFFCMRMIRRQSWYSAMLFSVPTILICRFSLHLP